MLGSLVERSLHCAVAAALLASTVARSDGTRPAAQTRRGGTHQSFTRSAGVSVLIHSPFRFVGTGLFIFWYNASLEFVLFTEGTAHFPVLAEVPSALPVENNQNQKQPAYDGWTARKRITMTANPASATDTLALLDKLKTELPEIWGQAQVVDKWVWLEFNIPPAGAIRERLKQLGFHWNGQRKCWQHPCGVPSRHSKGDPRQHYPVQAAEELVM